MPTQYSPLKKVILLILIAFGSIYADLSRSGNSVSDTATNLQWQDTEDANTTTRNWTEAIGYCEALELDSYDDWRLPNKKELLSIADRSRYNPSIDSTVFVNIVSYYWSSTTYIGSFSYAWYVNFNDGSSTNYRKTYNYYVRCVRGGQFGDLEPVVKMPPSIIMYLIN